MVAVTDILSNIYTITKAIYDQVQQAKANKAQCQRLYERILIATQAIKQLEKIKDAERYRPGLFALQKCLQNCAEYIKTFADQSWFKRVLKAGAGKEDFEKLNTELQIAIAQLDLGLNAQQIINREQDKVDQAKDYADIQARQDMIIKLNEQELKKIEEMRLHQDDLHEILVQQLASMREQIKALNIHQTFVKSLIDPKLVISYFDLVFKQKINEGSFGKIFMGQWSQQTVAIKTLEGKLSPEDQAQFIREVEIMSRLHHPNIVQLYGASLESGRACLVMEYMEQGSLWWVLRKGNLKPEQQKQIALDIARGLHYLHSKDILHRDLKSANILINKHDQAKLADFGLAKTAYKSIQTIKSQSQAMGWLAPETLHTGDYTKASDLYSFGMLLWEIVTGKEPYQDKKPAEIIKHVVDRNQREALAANIPEVYRKLIDQCWQVDPKRRPALSDILRQLEAYQPRPASPSAETYYQSGLAHEQKKEYQAAYQDYQRSADKGYMRAYTNVGTFYLKGLGGAPVDKPKAFQNFMQAAKLGHGRAMFNAAMMLDRGDGISPNPKEALVWYDKAAQQGDQKAAEKAQLLHDRLQDSDCASNMKNLALEYRNAF